MLVLTRKLGEEIKIGDDVTLKLIRVKGNSVRIAFDAPPDVKIYRSEYQENSQKKPSQDSQEKPPASPTL